VSQENETINPFINVSLLFSLWSTLPYHHSLTFELRPFIILKITFDFMMLN
jgi:hypothetical protein